MYQLSDPWLDFTHPDDQEILQKIVSKRGMGLTATDLMIIFDPCLPAGTVEENLCYLPLAFNFLEEKITHYQAEQRDDGTYDCWENVLRWAYRYKSELLTLNQYEPTLIRIKRVMETLMAFPWALVHEGDVAAKDVSILFFVGQMLSDAIGQDILMDIDADYPRAMLEHFTGESERDAAMALYLYDASLYSYQSIAKHRDLLLSIYPTEILQERWLQLSQCWEQLAAQRGSDFAPRFKRDILDGIAGVL